MEFDYDVVIIGGAFSGAATALMLPFDSRRGRIGASAMKFYNRRRVALAKRRLATGHFGRHSAGWRELYDGFVPDFRVTKLLRKGFTPLS